MDLNYAGYLLFVIPGFCFVWTYRHFTKKQKIGEFEYAVWSFLWGVPQFLLAGFLVSHGYIYLPSTPLDNSWIVLGSLIGRSISIVIGISFVSGFIAALVSSTGLFDRIDKKLFWFLQINRR